MHKLRHCLFLILMLVLLCTNLAFAAPELPAAPTSSIYVQDYAEVLDADTEAAINAIGTALQAKTKAQIVVVTIPDLQGYPIEDYALALFRKWGIGDQELNNGVLMLIAPQERKSRIEVGYGLEGALPDGKTGRIQDEYMLPFFKEGDYNSGIYNGYLALVNETAAEYNVTIDINPQIRQHTATQELQTQDSAPSNRFYLLFLLFLFIADLIFFRGRLTRFLFYMLLLSRGGRGGGGGFGGGGFGGGSAGGGGSSRSW